MQIRTALLLTNLMLSASIGMGRAAFAQTAEAIEKTLARCVDDSAVAVAQVDLARIDVAAVTKQLAERSQGVVAAGDLPALNSLAVSVKSLKAAGVQNVFVVFTPAPLGDRNPYYVAVLGPGGDVSAVLRQMKETPNPSGLFVATTNEDTFLSVAAIGNAVVAGHRGIVSRLQRASPIPRPELEAAMAEAVAAPFALLFVPSADQRKAFDETLPELPPAFGGGPASVFTRGLTWAAITYAPERETWELFIRSQNADAAKALRHQLRELPGKLTAVVGLRTVFPDGRLPESLLPAVAGDALHLTVNQSDPGAIVLKRAFAEVSQVVRSSLWKTARRDRLKQMAIAMHNYHDVYRRFPGQASYDKNGHPRLSWRVLILPFLEENKLYKRFHLDEPWDSEHNKQLIELIPPIYRSPGLPSQNYSKTVFLGPAGKHSLFHGAEGVAIRQITDGTSTTIMIVEAPLREAVVWTKPEDFDVDTDRLHERLFQGRDSFGTAFCDGSAHVIGKSVTEKTLEALFTINGREVVPDAAY